MGCGLAQPDRLRQCEQRVLQIHGRRPLVDCTWYVDPHPLSLPATDSRQVGGDVDFPFAFMRGSTEGSSIGASSVETEVNRPKSEVFLGNHISQTPNIDLIAVESLTAEPETVSIQARPPTKQQPRQSAPSQDRRRRSTKQCESAEGFSDRKRSMSMPGFEELKTTKSGREKFPFLQRLGRSLSRRMSST